MGMMERYILTRPEIERLHDFLLRTGEADADGAEIDPETAGTLEMLELMLSTATEVTIRYEGPIESLEELVAEEDLCANCAKPLDDARYSDDYCDELCEEAGLERQHQEEVASGEYVGVE